MEFYEIMKMNIKFHFSLYTRQLRESFDFGSPILIFWRFCPFSDVSQSRHSVWKRAQNFEDYLQKSELIFELKLWAWQATHV